MATAPRRLRSSLSITLGVWKALFLREVMTRLARRSALWLLAEPVLHVAFLAWLFAVGFRQRHVAGVDSVVFVLVGVLAFFLPRNMITRGMRAVDASDAVLYAFRQVRPVDTVVSRIIAESLLALLLFALVMSGAALCGLPVRPADPLLIIAALAGLWLAGLGLALALSVVAATGRQAGRALRLLLGPLYIFSGVMYPSSKFPPPIRDMLLLNPFLHGVESVRLGFMPAYHVPSGISLVYLYQAAAGLVFLGLVLHVRYRDFLVAR